MNLEKIITAGLVGKNYGEHRKIILTISFLAIASFTFFLFAIINLQQQNYPTAALDTTAGCLTLFALLRIYLSKKVFVNAIIGSIALFAFLISFVSINQNSSFGIIWTIFYPIFIITLLGRKVGLVITLFYYAILFSLAFKGIDVWQNGMWDTTSFLRFSIASLVLTYVITMHEISIEKAQAELDKKTSLEAEHTKKLKLLSITDPLTSLYNRRYFDAIFDETLQEVKRKEDHFILFIYDVDFFKRFNDTYGHQAGDDALVCISHTIKNLFKRENDYLFRIGGEEFAGIIKAENITDSIKHIQELPKAIEALRIENKGNDASEYITISLGALLLNNKENLDRDYLYKKVDDALYEAKNSGRNRAIFAPPTS